MTNIRWRIVVLLLIATVINYTDRVNLSYVAPTFMQQFHIGAAEMGVVLSAFLWTYFLVPIPVGLALDRLGVRLIYGGAALLWGGATVLTATVTGLGSLVGWRALLGLGEAPMVPATTKVMGIWVADQERGLAAALGGVAGIPIGVFISSPFIGWLLADFGWRAVFVGTGVLAVIWAIVWFIYYRDPAAHREANDAERRFLTENIAKISQPDAIHRASWGQLLANRNVVGLSLGQAALLFNTLFPAQLAADLPDPAAPSHHAAYRYLRLHTMAVRPAWGHRRRQGIRYSDQAWVADHQSAQGVSRFGHGLRDGLPAVDLRNVVDRDNGMPLVAVFGILMTNSVVWAANAEVAPFIRAAAWPQSRIVSVMSAASWRRSLSDFCCKRPDHGECRWPPSRSSPRWGRNLSGSCFPTTHFRAARRAVRIAHPHHRFIGEQINAKNSHRKAENNRRRTADRCRGTSGRGRNRGAALRQCQCGGPPFARHPADPELYRADQDGPHRSRRALGDPSRDRVHDGRRRALGVRLRRQ